MWMKQRTGLFVLVLIVVGFFGSMWIYGALRQASAANMIEYQNALSRGEALELCSSLSSEEQVVVFWREPNTGDDFRESWLGNTDHGYCATMTYKRLPVEGMFYFEANVPDGTKLWIANVLKPEKHLTELVFTGNRTNTFVLLDSTKSSPQTIDIGALKPRQQSHN